MKPHRNLEVWKRSIHFIIYIIIFLLSVACCLLSTPAFAAIEWNLSVVEGYYVPRLYELNYILKYMSVELGPRNTEAKPFAYPVIYQGYSPENMPEMKPSSLKTGLQLEAKFNPSYSIVIGGSTATLDSTKRDIRPFFVGFIIPSARETRFSLLLNQIWIGARRYWVWNEEEDDGKKKSDEKDKKSEENKVKRDDTSPKDDGQDEESLSSGMRALSFLKGKTGFFAEIGVMTVTRAYLTTDVWMHVYAPDEGFDFYKVTETGISGSGFATYAGIGGAYQLNKWLSLGMSANYMMGGVRDMKFVHYFTVDPLEEDIIKNGDGAIFLDLRKGASVPLILNLDGWDIKGEVKVHF